MDLLACMLDYDAGVYLDFWERAEETLQYKKTVNISALALEENWPWTAPSFFPCYCTLQLVDWDHDGDLDLFIGVSDGILVGTLVFLEAAGSSFLPYDDSRNPLRDIDLPGIFFNFQVFEWRGDTQLCLLVSDVLLTHFFEQDSKGRLRRVPDELNPFRWIPVASIAFVVDFDGDAAPDILVSVSMLNTQLARRIEFWRQTGSQILRPLRGQTNPYRDLRMEPKIVFDMVDWDRDGRWDFLQAVQGRDNDRYSWEIVLWLTTSPAAVERRVLEVVPAAIGLDVIASIQAVSWNSSMQAAGTFFQCKSPHRNDFACI